MPSSPPLLTVVIEAKGALDLESELYRRIVGARLESEDLFEIRHVDQPLTTQDIAALCQTLVSNYVVFVRSTHEISPDYVSSLLTHLAETAVYLAEPVVYTGTIPSEIEPERLGRQYYYSRDTDVFGVAFNTRRLADFLAAAGQVDRSALYISYRLYWSIDAVQPLATGFSMASDLKAATGIMVEDEVRRLLPLYATHSVELRLYLLRYMALFLRGLRTKKSTKVGLAHIRDVIITHNLLQFVSWVDAQQVFEGTWLRWLADSETAEFLYKQLTNVDAFLVYQLVPQSVDVDLELYRIDFNGETVTIGKKYAAAENREGFNEAANYDFYRRPVGPGSTILFFDRPMQADDNAEYLYDYFVKNHPEFTEVYFALNPRSSDWERLARRGFKLVPIFSTDFYEKFLISDLVVSSQIYNVNYKGKSFTNSRFVYLQHGVQLNDMRDWILSKSFDVFVATGKIEADYLSKLAPVETINSGLPRYESLSRAGTEAGTILFMPTWRFNLHQLSIEQFTQSEYYKAIDAVLTDVRLTEYLRRTGKTMEVKLHPNVEKRSKLFHFSERVVQSNSSYRQAIESAEFVFTDYSSAVLDAAFVEIPIAYYQWDAVEFFHDQPYESRLDYRDDGLGPVFDRHTEIIDFIVHEQHLVTDEEYSRRRELFFEGVDSGAINAKIIERMLSL